VAQKNLGRLDRAIECNETALSIHREVFDRRSEGRTLGNLANAYATAGNYQRAIELYEQRLVIARELEDRRGEALALAKPEHIS
jgi:tetratricopeptide (TPR) repeat protein